MTGEDKREHCRIDSLNLSHVTITFEGETIKQGMGRTLNVSESGILLETHFSVEKGERVALSIGLEEELLDIEGETVYSKAGESDSFETGIRFFETDQAMHSILKKYIKAFMENRT
jgi:hypothetical protein